ncbi:MAG: serine acetyltransferase [Oscillospiraceae bacterium]|nr:serine acetyltransferase [Oscillospiraceae bacterium]
MADDYREKEIAGIVASLMESYERHSGDNGLFPHFLPNRDIIVEVIESLRKILFPGYFEKDGLDETYITYSMASLVIDVSEKLQLQICRALNYETAHGEDCFDHQSAAHGLTIDFLRKLPDIRESLLADVDATLEGDPAARDKHEIIFAYPGIFAITVYRLAHELFLLQVPLIPRMMTEYAHSLTGIDIHPGAAIGHSFFIDHGTGIVFGETTEIGDNVKIYQGVTLGAISTRGGQSLRGIKRHPTLEDEVTVYASTTILGGDTVVGRGSVIGANAFITQSVPRDTRVSMRMPELELRPRR